MADATGSLGQLGQFLALALILPGLVYVGVSYLFFPDIMKEIAGIGAPEKDGGAGALGIVAAFFFLALVLSATSFMMEHLLWNKVGVIPQSNFGKLAIHESTGKVVTQLRQQLGQAFMHYNIACGTLLLLVAYLVRGFYRTQQPNYAYVLLAVLTILTNWYVCRLFYEWSNKLMTELDTLKSTDATTTQ